MQTHGTQSHSTRSREAFELVAQWCFDAWCHAVCRSAGLWPEVQKVGRESGHKSETLIANGLNDGSYAHHTPHRYADMSILFERLDLLSVAGERDGS